MNSAPALSRPAPHAATIRETAGLALAAAVTPLLVHLLPSWDAVPLGAHLLPMFWTALVAVYFFGARTGAIVAVAGPAVSLLLSGAPALARLGTMTAELLVFVVLTAWAVRRWPRFWVAAPLGYVTAKLIVSLGLLAAGVAVSPLLATFAHASAGLVILAAIHLALVRLARREA